jgi:hypothetical protein
MVGGTVQDEVLLGARAPQLLRVSLADAKGDVATPANAHRVQSINPNFQVLSYTAVYYPQDGSEPKTYQSLSRLLRPDVASWSDNPGTLVIKDISLLSSNGTTKIQAEPLIVAAHE